METGASCQPTSIAPFRAAPFKFSRCPNFAVATSSDKRVWVQTGRSVQLQDASVGGPEEGCRALFIHERCEGGSREMGIASQRVGRSFSAASHIEMERGSLRERRARSTKRSRSSMLLAYLAASPRPIQGSWAFLVSKEATLFRLPMLCLRDCWLHRNHIMKRRHNMNASLQKAAPHISASDFIWFRCDQIGTQGVTMLPNHHRIPDRHTIHRDPVTPPPPPKGRGSMCTPWQETLTCTLRYFLPAAVHIFHQWGEGLHTGVIPQDIASSWAKYQWCSEMSSALPLQKIFSVFYPPVNCSKDRIVWVCVNFTAPMFVFSSRINRPGQREVLWRRGKPCIHALFRDAIFQNLIKPWTDDSAD